ncbi:MAG TPA: toll/interleukin-1 receptor domain-containing protein [Steroidobacteraceae bacterium]|nr:toll/interleukin-1 receptor domain-containing protein [Steroidobacteraceae bacterium]
MDAPTTPQFRYRAFISYSHADEQWAQWLHRSLETYKLPKRLVGKETPFGPVPARLAPVFRDRDELATATSLGDILTAALEQSACQLVICSRKSARSRWVNEEIKTFKRLGKAHRIFAVIVDGEPHASANPATADEECFPPALIFRMGADGQLTDEPVEPIAADLRPGKDSKLDVKLKLVAGMVGVGLDELKQREAHRRHRQAMFLAAASVAGMAITSTLAGAAWLARNEAERQRIRAENEAETARQTTRFMVDLFKVSDPSEALGNKITAREILDKGAARIDTELAGQPVIQATLMDTMGTVYTSLGLYDSAASLVRKAYERRLRLWGTEHAEVANSLNHLGEVLMYKAEFAEAEKRLREALVVRKQLFGRKSLEVAETLSKLTQLLWETGKYDDAEPFAKEALAIRRKVHGRKKPHADVAASLEALGLNYYRKAEYEPAIAYLREAAAMQKDLHPGGAHPALAQAIDSLAFGLADSGRFDEAEPHARLALAMKRQLYGEDHPGTANTLNNLAFILESQQRYDDAEAAYRAALTINRKRLGESHPTVALNLSNIAYVEYAKGESASAIRTLRESLEISRRGLGPEHPQVGGTAANLAYWLIEEGKHDEARLLVDEALAIRRKALGEKHPQFASTLTIEAYLLLSTGHFEEARQVAERARATLTQAAMPVGSWQVSAAMNVEGAALMRAGRYAEAEPLLVNSLEGLKVAPIPNLAERGKLRLIELYQRWGKPEQVARLRAEG